MLGNLLFVHGTGVRLAGYRERIAAVARQLRRTRIEAHLVECNWGGPLGSMFEGKSLPDPPDEEAEAAQAQELARWTWLFDDPLAELERLSIRSGVPAAATMPGVEPEWARLLSRIQTYRPSLDVTAYLERAGIEEFWASAFGIIISAPVVVTAFEHSAEANELADAGIALSRAVVAMLHGLATEAGHPPLNAAFREALVAQLQEDWEVRVFGLGQLLSSFAERIGTGAMRKRRNAFNAAIAGPIGDILLYQSRGAAIRQFIRRKIEAAESPVTLVGHSLGGIACFDLLALPQAPTVAALVTVGSQAPYFYEVDALASIRRPTGLPAGFPPWLNVYDRNDFLSFVAGRIFPDRVEDFEAKSGVNFPEAHSTYLGSEEVWDRIATFLAR